MVSSIKKTLVGSAIIALLGSSTKNSNTVAAEQDVTKFDKFEGDV